MVGENPRSRTALRSTNDPQRLIFAASSPLGRRPRALPPPARHPPDAAGKAIASNRGPASSRAKDADTAATAIIAEFGELPTKACRTITHDNGGEFARHETVTEAIGMHAYFCDPHSPWQRGSIENGNGRIRRDLPAKPASQTTAMPTSTM
jgi:hypothetical protein